MRARTHARFSLHSPPFTPGGSSIRATDLLSLPRVSLCRRPAPPHAPPPPPAPPPRLAANSSAIIPVAPSRIFAFLGLAPPPGMPLASLANAFKNKAYHSLSAGRKAVVDKAAAAIMEGAARYINRDYQAVIAGAIGPTILGRSVTLTGMATAVAAAVRRKEKPAEVARQLSAFTSGDFTLRTFRAAFVEPFAGKYMTVTYKDGTPTTDTTTVAAGTVLLEQASLTFTGPVEGCVFKKGAEGIGYYKDIGVQTVAPVLISQHKWRVATRHKNMWGAGGVPETRAPARRLRMKQSKLLSAMKYISDPTNLQLLAYGDHKIKVRGATSTLAPRRSPPLDARKHWPQRSGD